MTYGKMLERRNGIFYFRQTIRKDKKQVVKRFSLRTSDVAIASFLALQIKASIQMIDLNKIKKFEIEKDDNGNIKSIKTKDDSDSQNLLEFLKLTEIHKAEQHKREIEKLKFEQELKEEQKQREQQKYLESPLGQENLNLYERLQSLSNKTDDKLTPLKNNYIGELKTTESTKYQYNNFITKFIEFCKSNGVFAISEVDRKIVYSYLLHLRKEENKEDSTIKNIFNKLSTFYNHLVRVGETKETNPFHNQKLEVVQGEREPFTIEEIEKIFSNQALQNKQKLFFICLILLTSGARPNEICQLWTDDIIIENSIIKVRITENKERGQSVKNKQSDRFIYLHPLVVKFGFLEYLKDKSLGMVFDLKKPSMKNYSTFVSEELTKILRSLGIKEKTMYCFRHTVLNRLTQAEVKDKIQQDLVGHEGSNTKDRRYVQEYPPEKLKEKTEKVLSYEEISFFK